jgi:Flp pilus assembly protein TadG
VWPIVFSGGLAIASPFKSKMVMYTMRILAANKLCEALCRFRDHNSGNVAIIFGFAFVPLLLATAGGVDYERAVAARAAIAQAADNGVLMALHQSQQQISVGNANWNSGAQQAAINSFVTNAQTIRGASVGSPTVSISQVGQQLTGQLTYMAQVPTSLLKVIGLPQIGISGTATASMTLSQYTDIHIVMDVSGSMGIGATATDQQTLMSAIGCTLACHYSDVYGSQDTLAGARASGATLRIDVVRSAVSTALSAIPSNGNTRVALYTFSNSLKTIFPLSSNISAAIAAANTIDLTSDVSQGGTNVSYPLTQLNSLLAAAGNGLSLTQPSGIVMLVTDGVEDSALGQYANGTSLPVNWVMDPNFLSYPPQTVSSAFQTIQGMNPSSCTPIKSKGYTMMTLDVQYLTPSIQPDASESRYQYIGNTLAPSIASNMASCASMPSSSFIATSSSQINQSVRNMFVAATSLRLTH